MLRKLWKAKLGEWLFASGLALAFLVPVLAKPSLAGGKGDKGGCTGSFMASCLDKNGNPCVSVPGDLTMVDACVVDYVIDGPPDPYPPPFGAAGVLCPQNCTTGYNGPDQYTLGVQCSVNNSCYY